MASIQRKEVEEKQLNETDAAFYIFRNEIAENETILNAKRREKETAEGILNSIKEKLTDMSNAAEMRSMIGNVAHDLKTVSIYSLSIIMSLNYKYFKHI